MDKFTIDYKSLNKNIIKEKRIKLADVKHNIEKVGFGVVRFIDDKNKTNLWQVIDNEYIVAMYDDPSIEKNDWSIESDKLNKNATIFYKNTPIKSIAFSEIGFTNEDEINNFKKIMPERLASNKELVKIMLNGTDSSYKTVLFDKYPELLEKVK